MQEDPAQGMPGMPGTLVGDFTEMVQGAGIYGCGIEWQDSRAGIASSFSRTRMRA